MHRFKLAGSFPDSMLQWSQNVGAGGPHMDPTVSKSSCIHALQFCSKFRSLGQNNRFGYPVYDAQFIFFVRIKRQITSEMKYVRLCLSQNMLEMHVREFFSKILRFWKLLLNSSKSINHSLFLSSLLSSLISVRSPLFSIQIHLIGCRWFFSPLTPGSIHSNHLMKLLTCTFLPMRLNLRS